MNPRRLTRSRDRQLAGVAGGMAEYLDIDPTIIRILWVIVVLATGGLALIAYVILALVMPQASYAANQGAWGASPAAPAPTGGWDAALATATASGPYAGPYTGSYAQRGAAPVAPSRSEGRGIGAAAIIGGLLIVFGVIALADAVLPGWAAGAIMGPALVLALGAGLLASSLRRRPAEAPQGPMNASTAAPDTMAAAPVTPAYATPSVPGMPGTPAAPWDITDTQAVDTVLPEAPDQGARPA